MLSRYSGMVLAGGGSRRMGRDKALLTLNGKTLLSRQIEKLRALGIEDILISGRAEAPEGARAVPDGRPGLGPLGGVCACLAAAKHPACLVLSVDSPLIPLSALRSLIEAQAQSGAGAAVLRHGERDEPLIAVYEASLLPLAEARLASGDRSMRGFLREAGFLPVPYVGDEALLADCDTAEEYEAFLRMYND